MTVLLCGLVSERVGIPTLSTGTERTGLTGPKRRPFQSSEDKFPETFLLLKNPLVGDAYILSAHGRVPGQSGWRVFSPGHVTAKGEIVTHTGALSQPHYPQAEGDLEKDE